MKVSYDAYDEKCEFVEHVNEKFPAPPYFPTEQEIIEMGTDFEKYYEFLVHLATNNPKPSTPEEAQSIKLINKLINENVEFVEEDDLEENILENKEAVAEE